MIKRNKPVLFFIYLIQDLDIVLPIVKQFKSQNFPYKVYVTRDLLKKSPRVRQIFNDEGVNWTTHIFPLKLQSLFRKIKKELRFYPSLRNISGLFCIVETSAGPHRVAQNLVRLANSLNLPTYTSQHGIDNIGLTYEDKEYPLQKTKILSNYIFTWADKETLLPSIAPEVSNRCLPFGNPKFNEKPKELQSLTTSSPIISIFENLHWGRYSKEYRQTFLDFIDEVCRQNSDYQIIVKPHHAGMWLTKNKKVLAAKKNLLVLDPADPKWEPYTAPALIARSTVVFSTPSTVILDSAALGVPTVLLRFNVDADLYAPITPLDTISDLKEILSLEARPGIIERSHSFAKKYSGNGDAAEKIANFVIERSSR